MKGLLTKDFLTVKKKYGITRLIMDLAIIAALMIILEGAGSIYISFLLVPLEVASMLITLAWSTAAASIFTGMDSFISLPNTLPVT